METNKVVKRYDPTMRIEALPSFTTTNNYVSALAFDTSKHPSFCGQVINRDVANVMSYKIETTFDGTNWKEVKVEADVAASGSEVFEDNSIGVLTRISVKSKVGGSHATGSIFIRLNPPAYIV